jgi:MerR family transcriptional regulator, light-induced transcriptional regulator
MDRLNGPTALGTLQECEGLPPELQGRPQNRTDLLGAPDPSPSASERMARIVRTIESDIIPRLVRAHRQDAPLVVVAAPPALELGGYLPAFVDALLSVDDLASWRLVEGLSAEAVSIDALYLELLAPAARRLGELWEEDLCSFTDVTVGLGRLQRALRLLSPAFGREIEHPADGRRALLLPAPGDMHTFGLSMVCEFFRRAGWEVVGPSESRSADPVALVRQEWFDIIGISVGSDARMDWLSAGISAVRRASRNRAIGVMVGGPLFVANPAKATELGADGTAADGATAPEIAERLMGERASRLVGASG